MKKRRLNVLFMAIIALAASPQALQDVHSLVNAAHERAETEFWSVFLSYQSPDGNTARTSASTELLAARSPQEKACPLQGEAMARASRSIEPSTRSRTQSTEARRQSAKANSAATQTFEVTNVDGEALANVYTVRAVTFSEKEEKALKAAKLHSRDAEKSAEAASRAALASFIEKETVPVKMRQLTEMDKLIRQRTRGNRDRGDYNYETTNPNPVGSM